jgi:4a-hydroxytetrahydrobiopterin dehydratase
MRHKALEEADVRPALAALPGWNLVAGRLRRELDFGDFVEAWGFMSSMALVSEAMNHHPEWSNVYRRVVIELCTHDAGGVTELDLEWARRAERVLRAATRQ